MDSRIPTPREEAVIPDSVEKKSPPALLDLPPEIRNRIYHIVFTSDHDVKAFCNGHSTRSITNNSLALLRTCHQVSNEATNMAYSLNTFLVPPWHVNELGESFARAQLRRSYIEQITGLALTGDTLGDFFLDMIDPQGLASRMSDRCKFCAMLEQVVRIASIKSLSSLKTVKLLCYEKEECAPHDTLTRNMIKKFTPWDDTKSFKQKHSTRINMNGPGVVQNISRHLHGCWKPGFGLRGLKCSPAQWTDLKEGNGIICKMDITMAWIERSKTNGEKQSYELTIEPILYHFRPQTRAVWPVPRYNPGWR